MKVEQFNEIAQRASQMLEARLIKKGKEYAIGEDRLANFKIQARMYNVSDIEALLGNMGKHQAWLEGVLNNPHAIVSDDDIWEHVGDIICYYVLLIGLMREKNDKLLYSDGDSYAEEHDDI